VIITQNLPSELFEITDDYHLIKVVIRCRIINTGCALNITEYSEHPNDLVIYKDVGIDDVINIVFLDI
jgi:hypothetical protein